MTTWDVIADRLEELREPEMAAILRGRVVPLPTPAGVVVQQDDSAPHRIVVIARWEPHVNSRMPLLGYERVGPDDLFLSQLPGPVLVKFSFPAGRWIGFRRNGVTFDLPGMPGEFADAAIKARSGGIG